MRLRRPNLAVVALGASLVFAARRMRLRRYEIVEGSMSPALEPGDFAVAVPARAGLVRGDVVIFPHPDRPSFELVKRVVGMPAEDVVVANGQVHIDGAVLPEPWGLGPTQPNGSWRLGAEVFVLGDQRTASASDSREIGPVPYSAVAWKVVARYWPLDRIGLI